MSKYVVDVINKWPWGFPIEWLNDRGMVSLRGAVVAEIRPVVDHSPQVCNKIEVVVYTRRSRAWPSGASSERATVFKFADYLCDVPRIDNRKDWHGTPHLWHCESADCEWFVWVPAYVGPLLLGIDRWLDYQEADV